MISHGIDLRVLTSRALKTKSRAPCRVPSSTEPGALVPELIILHNISTPSRRAGGIKMLIDVTPGFRQRVREPWTLGKLHHERCLALGSAIDTSTLGPYHFALNSYLLSARSTTSRSSLPRIRSASTLYTCPLTSNRTPSAPICLESATGSKISSPTCALSAIRLSSATHSKAAKG